MDSSPTMEKKENVTEKEKDRDPINDDDIMIDTGVIGDDLLFSDDPFPDFPSPSASSTSDFHQKPALPLSSSSSSSPSPWSFLDQAPEPSMQDPMVGPTTAEGSTVTHIAGDIGLWDPSNPLDSSFFLPDDFDAEVQDEPASHVEGVGNNNANSKSQDPKPSPNPNPSSHDQELSKIFLEWLKSNRDTISLEDLRSIKLKTSTVECAAARLGGGKQGKMQLLKLILAWVQNHHLLKKRRRGGYDDGAHPDHQPYLHYQFAPPNPNPNLGYGCNVAGPWNDNTVNYATALPSMNAPPVPQPSAMCAPHGYYPSTSAGSVVLNSQPFSPSADLHAFSPHPIQRYPPFHGTAGLPLVPQYSEGCSSQYPMHPSSSLAGASSATKEARKKRMARQRRNSTLHHQHRILINQNEHSSEKASAARPAQSELAGSSSSALNHNNRSNMPRNWDLWSRQKNSLSAGASPSSSSVTNMHQSPNIVGPLEKRQGLKSEKNLKFLLQKVLKQSDVGSLGRIVLPKKEAETHLPVLDARDGIPILMEDIGISRAWNMRYRYWPNNKSRMYLLENTGDFVRSNGLQEGDFIVIYSDVRHNKYMIRGVKVRQAAEDKGAAARRQNTAKALQKKIGRSDGRVQGSGTFSESNNNSCMGDLPPCGEEDGDTSPSKIMVDDM